MFDAILLIFTERFQLDNYGNLWQFHDIL